MTRFPIRVERELPDCSDELGSWPAPLRSWRRVQAELRTEAAGPSAPSVHRDVDDIEEEDETAPDDEKRERARRAAKRRFDA